MILGLVVGVALQTPVCAGDGSVRIWEEDVIMPSYRLDAPDRNPMFYKHESYQGAEKRIYPYPFQEHVTEEREERPFRFVFLENDYIKLSVLPEVGGRLFSAQDKTDGYDIFYRQSVIKPALIGMLGAWISGGVEWCVFHHHRNTTHMPVDYTLVENEDGSKTIWFGETERRQRMKWLIGVTLYPDRSVIEATVKLFNRTPLPHSMLYWANVAVHVNDQYQVIFPPSVSVATYHAKNDFVHWPIGAESYQGVDYSGVDLSWWKNHPEPISFFAWNLQEDFMGGYDHGRDAGVVHVGNHEILSGAKLWEWSPGPRGRMWDKILTDTDGPYAELMVGAYSDNQPDYSWIQPGEVRTFKQIWYPIRGIGGFKKANREAAVNLERVDASVRLGFNATRLHEQARIVLRRGTEILLETETRLGPDSPFLTEVALDTEIPDTELIAELFDEEGQCLIRYQPRPRPEETELPSRVVPPPPPREIGSQEELYLTGLRLEQIHNPSLDPEAYFLEALRRDPGDSRPNTLLGINRLKQGRYAEAETYLRKAIERITFAYTRPNHAEAYFNLGLVLRAQGRLDEAWDSFYRASWDAACFSAAHLQLAELAALRGDLEGALSEVEQSLSGNSRDNRARGLKAAILRRLGRVDEAQGEIAQVLTDDPLDFFAANEQVLASAGQEREAAEAQWRSRLREDLQAYLELATDYGRLGFWSEAVGVLQRGSRLPVVDDSPLTHYYLGYYQQQLGQTEAARASFRQGSERSFEYCFPFRRETEPVLLAAIAADPADGRAHYYLGNLLFEDQPERAVAAWEQARELEPGLALVHRNLGWAYARVEGKLSAAIDSYEAAVAADPGDPRFYLELDELYERANADPARRLQMLTSHHAVVARRNYSFLREILVDVLVGRYDAAIEALSHNTFHVREGGGEIHDVYVDAHLLRGLEQLRDGDAGAALAHFREAARYPENLSVGVPRHDRRAAEVAYRTGEALEAGGEAEAARREFERAADGAGASGVSETLFYQGLALRKLGREAAAADCFERLATEGRRRIDSQVEVDFFAKFGEQQTEAARKAEGHYLLGLGYLGQGLSEPAAGEFAESVRLNRARVWASYYAMAAGRPLPATAEDRP